MTRYLLFQLPAPGAARGPRCGPGAAERALCPPAHRYRNGTVVALDDPAFPFRAYHSVSQRVRGADGAFHCKVRRGARAARGRAGLCREPRKSRGLRAFPNLSSLTSPQHDCWSNPCDQDWVRIEPSPEWAEYGFPESVAAAMTPRKWVMDAGAVTAAMSPHFSGATPPLLAWTTLNMGPEMMGPPGTVAVWEVAESDVLIEEGSQGA